MQGKSQTFCFSLPVMFCFVLKLHRKQIPAEADAGVPAGRQVPCSSPPGGLASPQVTAPGPAAGLPLGAPRWPQKLAR